MKIKKPEIDKEKLGTNPFIQTLVIPVNSILLHGQWKKDKDGIMLPLEIELEREESCRVYLSPFKRLYVSKLSSRGKELLLWLIYEANNAEDYIWINKPRYMKENDIKADNTVRDAIRELHNKAIIAPTTTASVYWINPNYFFNGSRINKFPDKIVRK